MSVRPSDPLPAQVRAHNAALVRRGLLVVLAGGVVALVLSGVLAGADGLLGAAAALVLVVLFFGSDVLLMRWTAPMDPVIVMGIVVMTYLLKLTLLAILLVSLRGSDVFSLPAFAATVVAETLIGIVVAMWLSARTRTFIDPGATGAAGPAAETERAP
jgi:ATP synthase protein I